MPVAVRAADPAPASPVPVAAPADASKSAEQPATEPAKPAEPAAAPATPAPAAVDVANPATPSTSAPAAVAVAEAKSDDKKPWPWAGSVAFRNMTGVTLFDPSYEQTWMPYEGLALFLTPRYKLNDTMSIGLWQYASVELSNTGNSTYYREPQLSDTQVSFAWTVLNTMPKPPKDKTEAESFSPSGFVLSTQAIVTLPTSKGSIAKTMYSAVALGLGARYIWKGLTVGLSSRLQHAFYKNTTMSYDHYPIETCTAEGAGCNASLLSSGVRSTDWRVVAIGSVSYSITKKLLVSASGGEIMDWLPSLAAAAIPAIGAGGQQVPTGDDQNFRALMYWGLGVDYTILPWLSAGIGLETYNSQLKADSTYETPFVNRYSTAYLELTMALDGLPH